MQVSYDLGLGAGTAGMANGDVEEIGENDTINLYYAAVEGAVISLEYLHNEFAGGAEEDSITGRLAIEF